jgi:fibronectin-binding autotransporter adhesin
LADRYWVGGTAAWDGTAGSKWALTSGGAGGQAIPTTADDVFFDVASGANTVTISTGNTGAKSITCTGFTGTLAGTGTITIAGSVTLVAAMTFTHSGTKTITGSGTLTTAAKNFGATVINGAGITVALGDSFTCSNFTLTQGTFNTANFNMDVGSGSYNSAGALTRTMNLGSSTLSVGGSGTAVAFSGTNFTLNAGTSLFSISTTTATFSGGGQTFHNVSWTGGIGSSRTINDANVYNNLTLSSSAASLSPYVFSADQTINGTLTCTGTSISQRVFVYSSTLGTARTLTVAALSSTDCDFKDITISGAAAGSSPTRAGNCGGNSGITFPAAKTVYWNLNGPQNWNATGWAPSSGGTPGVNNFPLAQDTAVFDNTGSVTGTITVSSTWNIGTLDMSARTTAMTLATGSNTPAIYGNWINGSGTTLTGTGNMTFAGRGITQTITSNGKSFTQGIILDTLTGIVSLADNFTGAFFYVFSGTFLTNNFNFTISLFQSSTASAKTITFGTSTISVTGTGTLWLVFGTGTFNFASSTINLTNTTTTARTFDGGAFTYGTINIGGTTGTSTTTFGSTAGMIIGTLASTKTVAHTIAFSAAQTINNWTVTGTAGNVVTVNSSAVGTQRTITYGGSRVNLDYMSFTDVNFSYTLGAANPYLVYAGANSVNGGNNAGIAFLTGTQTAYLLTSGTSWTVPVGWNNSNNVIHMIGAGGGGGQGATSGNNRAAGGGGGGGGYTVITNFSASPLSSIAYAIGTSGVNVSGGDTGFGQNTISFVASTTLADTAASTTHVMNVPSGTANGDLMLLFIAASANSGYTVPTGWTLVINTIALMICRRIASSEPASYTVTTSNLACTGYIATYRNAEYDVVGASSIESSPSTAPSINVTYNNSVVLDFASGRTGSVTFTTPTGFSSIASESNTTSPSSALFSRSFNSGATGTATTTLSAGAGFSILLAIRPTLFYVAGGGQKGNATTAPLSTGGARWHRYICWRHRWCWRIWYGGIHWLWVRWRRWSRWPQWSRWHRR